MVWSAPMTAVTGNVFTAAQFNQYVRDNLLVSAPAIATIAGGIIASTAANVVVQRTPAVDFLGLFESTASSSYVDLTTVGPTVTVTTGTKALVSVGGQAANNTVGLGSRISAAISGATTTAAGDANSYYNESANADDGHQGTWTTINSSLNAGSNTWTVKYRTTAGGGTSDFGHRLIAVMPF